MCGVAELPEQDLLPIGVFLSCARRVDQDHEDLALMFTVRLARQGEFDGQDVARFEANTLTGELLGKLGPIPLPADRESPEYESALLTFTDEALRICEEAKPAIISALRAALETPNLVDGIDVRANQRREE